MLKELREKLKKAIERMKALRAIKPEEMTDEKRTDLETVISECEGLKVQIETEERANELDAFANRSINDPPDAGDPGGDGDPPPSNMDVPDNPIYRGDETRALTAQIRDTIVMMTNRERNQSDEVRKAAEKRYNENRTREITLLEKDQPDFRAAGTGQVQGIASEGGMFLTGSTAVEIMDRGFNNSEVLSRCRRITLGAGEAWAELIDIDETSRADDSRQGGIRVYTEAELGEYDSSMTKFQKMRIEPKKLTGLIYFSEEINMNAPIIGQEVRRLFENEFAWKKQDQVIEGTGAGTAQGIMNADCKVSIPKETGQQALTIVTENILKMIERFQPNSGGKPAFFYNRNCFSQLMKMTYDVGSGGELSKLFTPPRKSDGIGAIWGYPAIPIEQAEVCGTAGDIWLTDFSKYIVADKGDVLQAVSIHVKFEYGQIALRFTSYFDGRPVDVSAITPFKNSVAGSTVSPFVRVAVRE